MFDAFVETAVSVAFWVALAKIIWVNILLSGDNAVVIALAARSLPPHQQKRAVIFGSAAAIVLRVLLTLFAVQLLRYPYLKLVGAALLLWIGIQLLVPEDDGDDGDSIASSDNLWIAIRTILIADLVMSLDNVIAVAAAAESGPPEAKLVLLLLGLGLSIPLIIVGSQVLLKIMDRWPIIITAGAGLLGFVAGEMAATDPAVQERFQGGLEPYELPIAIAGAAFVVVVGTLVGRRKRSRGSAA
jgi:YjbE family integral membrane protein